MPAIEPFYRTLKINHYLLTRHEKIFLEFEIFLRVTHQLANFFRATFNNHFAIMKLNIEKEYQMIENNFTQLIINDILATQEYTLEGIAQYTHTPAEVILEIAMGQNNNPSANLHRKSLELHRMVRRELYEDILAKVLMP